MYPGREVVTKDITHIAMMIERDRFKDRFPPIRIIFQAMFA